MRKKFVFAAVVLALVCGAYGGWHWWTDWRFLQSTDDAYVASDVSVISPKVEGYIKEVHFRDNEAVKKGAVLFVIDDSDFAAKVAQAQAAGRYRTGGGGDLCQPARPAEGDDCPGAGDAGLGRVPVEISWVQTAYLIADVVMVPLSGMLSRLVSTRLPFVTAILWLYRGERLVRDGDEPQPDDRLPGAAGVLRRGDHAERVSGRLHAVPRAAADAADGDDLGHPEPVVDARADDRRVPDRHPLVELAVSRQHRARHCRRRGRVELRQHRQARPVAAALFRRDRAGADGDLPRLSRIRARGRAAVGLARRYDDPRRGLRVRDSLGVVLLAGADIPAADRRFARLQ